MQPNTRSKFSLKIALVVVLLPCVAWLSYKVYKHLEAKAYVYWKANPVFGYKFHTNDKQQKGYLLLTPSLPNNLRYGKIMIMDLQGQLLQEKQLPGTVSDFRQWKIEGRTLYSYMMYDSNANQELANAGSARCGVILDSALNEIKTIHLLSYGDIVVNSRQDLDHHDIILLPGDHYIVMAVYPKKVGNIPAALKPSPNCRIAAPIIQEVKNGEVIWEWDGSRFPEFYVNSSLGNKFSDTAMPQDYTHINSMFIDPRDSNLIVSLHNVDQVIKIDRHTGDIIWRLGGKNSDFPMTPQQIFLRQHHATLVDNNQVLMLLDNGDKPAREYSRILEFRLDEQKKTITSFKAFKIEGDFAGSRGSVQKVGDIYFICGGSANYVQEVNSLTGSKIMELKTNQPLYRAYMIRDITGIPVIK